MEVKVSKKGFYLFTVAAVVLLVGGVVWSRQRSTAPSSALYAGVSGNDLPTVVGEPSLGGPKIPFTETVNYKEYTPEVLSTALASGNATLLYFYANWCGTCRGQEPINQEFFRKALEQQLSVNGIRVDVDVNQQLMRQYRINYQHSYVLLDKTGNPVDRFYGDHSAEEILKKVQKVL